MEKLFEFIKLPRSEGTDDPRYLTTSWKPDHFSRHVYTRDLSPLKSRMCNAERNALVKHRQHRNPLSD